ncbi:unnamed protein product [Angiostrongylus costaricensis]|uniref:IRG-type G domain-containing protein n=1 Tax=Angiostrongylus costaricensis TaxID=334426 RepID=A0A0R3PWB5_ANGCS|nr:unnamed protein product [Angiostrongylus costaricensis]
MGNGSSKSRLSDHVALPNSSAPIPNVFITRSSSMDNFERPKPISSLPTPLDGCTFELDPRETMVLAGTPPPDRPPPPPPEEALHNCGGSYFGESTIIQSDDGSNPPPLPPGPRAGLPVIKRNIVHAKDCISQFDALNTTDRPKVTKESQAMRNFLFHERTQPFSYAPLTESSTTATTKSNFDEYPVYNPVTDYTFKSGMSFQLGAFPIDTTRVNMGFCGRQGAGKSTLINALRGLTLTDPQAAGRHPCNNMEPFRYLFPSFVVNRRAFLGLGFLEDELQNIVLWEIPYPRAFASVSDIYDRNMGFDRFYESHKLNLFRRVFLLIADGAPHDDDISFARIVHSRFDFCFHFFCWLPELLECTCNLRTPLTMLSTKSDDDLDAESREFGRSIDNSLKREYDARARSVFIKSLMLKAQILTTTELLLISSPVVKNLVSGTIGYLHYKLDEDKLLELVDLQPGCHYALENQLRKSGERTRDTSSSFPPHHIQKSTILADAGFEILFGTDDRVFGNLEPKSTTAFNYGFIGGAGVGKSAIINSMRGMSSKHPLAAGKTRMKPGSCERFEFDDDLLKYSVTLFELHYPKKISAYFEFIEDEEKKCKKDFGIVSSTRILVVVIFSRYNIASFTAIFVLIDETPSDEDLSFSKIAHRRNAAVVFLSSKSDRKLAARSRSDEIPVCDLLKQRFVDKGLSRFDRSLAANAPELCGRVHAFFVSAPVFRALRVGDARGMQFILHERAVFDFLKQKRIVADLLDSPKDLKEGLHANVNLDTAGVTMESS